jgi:transposase
VEADLAAMQGSDKDKASRLAQVESELAALRQSEEEKGLRAAQAEAELLATRREKDAIASRLVPLEAELAQTRRTAEEATTLSKLLQDKHRPRTITREQRNQFLEATRGQAKGKVIVSAIFFNKETHETAAEVLSLLKEAGFDLVEPAPLNFFTTSRPVSGIRVGFKNDGAEPSQVATLQKGFRAIGWDLPTTTLVNAQESDIAEIQVTPKE